MFGNRDVITMTTIKSYTDIEQSKKLAKFLPLESADYFHADGIVFTEPYKLDKDDETVVTAYKGAIPCWSLAALLEIIPKRIKEYNTLRIDISVNDFAIWYDKIGFGVNNALPDIIRESAVDACVEMILKLKENNLL